MHGRILLNKKCQPHGIDLNTTIYWITTKVTFLWVAFIHWMRKNHLSTINCNVTKSF